MRRLTLLSLAALAAFVLACGEDEPLDDGRSGITTRTPAATDATPRPAATPRAPSTPRTGAAPSLPGTVPGQAQLEWAEAFCATTASFDEAVIAVQDDLNPRELEFEERRERALRRYAAYVEGAEAGAQMMRQFRAPPDAMAYHEAVTEQFEAFVRLFTEQYEFIEQTESHEEIDAAVADLQRAVEELDVAVRMASGMLSPETIRALQAMPRCGGIVG